MVSKIIGLLTCCIFIVSPLTLSSSLLSPSNVSEIDSVESQADYPYALDHVIMKLWSEVKVEVGGIRTHIASLDSTLEVIGAESIEAINGLEDIYLLKIGNDRSNIMDVVAALNSDPAVEYAEPDYLAEFASIPDDPRYSEQWGLAKVEVEGAWDQTMGLSSVVIAVIDSGIDLTHEDLAPNLWVNPGEIASNAIDDDNNGFVDDVQGWNFVNATNNVQDYIGHGSLVSGVAAARINNTIGISGVCGNCRIMPVKVSQISGFANYSDIAAGVNYAVQKGAKVINLSVGGYANSITLKNAIDSAIAKNVVVVAGAGNDNKSDLFYPAAYEGVIAVAGTDESDVKTTSSNYGVWVDVSAPGQNILSTTLGDYSSDSGTSYAAPFVSGAAGLVLSLHPDWTPVMVRSQFMHTTDEINTLNAGFEGKLGSGRLNTALAMQPSHPILIYQSFTGNDIPNLRPDFGSTVNLNVSIYNDWADTAGVTGILSSADPYVTITTTEGSFGDMLAGESKSNDLPFTFDIATGAGYNHTMAFELSLSADGGAYTTAVNFTITTRSSEEVVSGTIDADTIWTSDKTYKVTGNIGVAPDYTLTIDPGTVVKFAGNYSLTMGGTLIAQGTASQPISFEPYTAGGTWNTINFTDTSLDAVTTEEGVYQSGNILQYVTLAGATGGISCTTATPYLDHVTTIQGGLTCSLGDTDLWLINSTLVGTVSITSGGSTPEHLGNVEVSGGSVTIPASQVVESIFSGLLTIQGAGGVSNTSVGSLTIQGVGDVQQVSSNGNISIASGQVMNTSTINGSIIISGSGTISECEVNGGSISTGSGSTVNSCSVKRGGISAGSGSTITRNNVENATGAGISTSGASSVTFNRIDGAGQGIVATTGTVENNLIGNITGDGLHPGTSSVRNNTFNKIAGNGVYLDEVPVAFDYNNFEFNTGTYDVYVTVPKTTIINLVAQNNWWGTTDSNLIKQRIYDYNDGDFSLAKLITVPVLTAPSQTAPGYVRSVTLDPESPIGIQTGTFTVEYSRPMDTSVNPEISFNLSDSDSWSSRTNMPSACYGCGAAMANNGKIYVIGGDSGVVNEYSPSTDSWIEKKPLDTMQYDLGVVRSNDGKIYAIGGEPFFGLVKEYDTLTDTWVNKASMPTGRSQLAVVAAENGKIYALGGWQIVTTYASLEEYDPSTNIWTVKTPMPVQRSYLAAVAVGSKIYAIGGNISNTIDEYNILTDTWTTKASTPIAGTGGAAVLANNGKIYVIGGGNSIGEYDPLADIWTTRTPMPTARSGFGVVLADDGKIYVLGGGNKVEVYTIPSSPIYITSTPQWVDNIHYQMSYDFSTLNPRGDYTITVDGSYDSDGMLLILDDSSTFTIDYAGEISDTTPPNQPNVTAWGNGSLTQLSALASASDPDSEIVGYRYAIGSTPGGTDVVNWTNYW